MPDDQDLTKTKFFTRLTGRQRLACAWICIAFSALCIAIILAAFNPDFVSRMLPPCGFKMRTGLPCPTCGYTRAVLAFFRGDIFTAFYIQPAGGVLCLLMVLTIFLSFIFAVFGVYFSFLKRLKLWIILLTAIIVIVGGWAVMLVRALT
jgi:hypothetical protein